MTRPHLSRRDFLSTSAAVLGTAALPYWFTGKQAQAFNFDSPSERPTVGCIGTGSRWGADGGGLASHLMKYGDVVAVCDVDTRHSGRAHDRVKKEQGTNGSNRAIDIYGDYQEILQRKDIDAVTIVTPDHWHSKIAIEAMQAGKDIYCEKPLTLTIDEGKQIIKVLKQTGRVFQVGTQQRSEMGQRFLQAIALTRDGRIGKVKRVQVIIGGAPESGPLKTEPVPSELNWEKWLGQAPLVDYIPRRGHYEFRWWYEYSGGKMTDWGAHHVDIAQWAIDMDNNGPTTVEGTATHPCPFEKGHPTADNLYNTATKFEVSCQFPNGVQMVIKSHAPELTKNDGILFEGESGRFFVNRGRITGAPVEELAKKPLPDGLITDIYKGKTPGSHMGNFFECIKTRDLPISDVYTHHRALTTCHLANIAIRLGRKIHWDAAAEQITGDAEAAQWTSREQRAGYAVVG